MNHPIDDPYRACEHGQCSHDLARAVTVADLFGTDGPFPQRQTLVNLGATTRNELPTLFDDMEEPLEAPIRRAG